MSLYELNEKLTVARRNGFVFDQLNKLTARKWYSERADPAKALYLSLAKQTNKTDKQKILATQMFELSTLAFLPQCSRTVLI